MQNRRRQAAVRLSSLLFPALGNHITDIKTAAVFKTAVVFIMLFFACMAANTAF
jgi:hypothetical protein